MNSENEHSMIKPILRRDKKHILPKPRESPESRNARKLAENKIHSTYQDDDTWVTNVLGMLELHGINPYLK